ncbi:hypothetical protein CRM82_00020 [Comamonas terrigena]|uniref:Uncharacterized protein n=2 Tax=Comamonas terrigena TaxID=32013 RepID=A0A2A7UPS8_COMTR|nr:hypothetical protein CRM82_00020 [Comamonas terrigena]
MLRAAENSVCFRAYVKVGLNTGAAASRFLAEFVSRRRVPKLCPAGRRISGERLASCGPV